MNHLDSSTSPLATILVLTYNHGPYIRECLESLINQKTSFPFEILVGEDCSTDDTRHVVEDIATKHPDLIRAYLSPANMGAKRNSANLRANVKGTYVAYCEGDDYWHRNDKLQKQVDFLEAHPEVSLVCSDVDTLIMSSGRYIPSVMKRIGQWQRWPEDVAKAILTRKINISTCGVCLRLETLLRIHRENPYECSAIHPMGDIQLFIEASRLGRIHPMQESLATYRAIEESATRSKDPAKVFDFLTRSLVVFEHYVRKLSYGPEVMNRVRMTHASAMIEVARNHPKPELLKLIRELVHEHNVCGETIDERFALWSLTNNLKFRTLSGVTPLLCKLRKVPTRIFREPFIFLKK